MFSPRRTAPVEDLPAAAEQELQEFSYIVSHDVAASIRHISEFSRLLLGELGGALTDRQLAHAERISLANAKCQLMMEQLLVYSRIQQKTLKKTRRDATQAMERTLKQLAPQAQAAGAEVAIEPLGEVFADQELLVLAFQHLLENAIKFHRPRVPPRIAVATAHDKAFWRARVTDNGIGVEPAHRDKSFWMFHRLQGEDAFPGIGAGLAVCRRIARRHGGEVRFLDCADGACVELSLPHAKTGAKSARHVSGE